MLIAIFPKRFYLQYLYLKNSKILFYMKIVIFFFLFLPCCLLISSCEFLYRERLDIYKKSLIAAPFYCTKLSCRSLYPPCFNTNEKSVINDSLKLIKLEFDQTNVRLTNAHYIYEHYLDTMTCN